MNRINPRPPSAFRPRTAPAAASNAQLTAGALLLVSGLLANLEFYAAGETDSPHGNPACDAYDLLAETLPVLELVVRQLRPA